MSEHIDGFTLECYAEEGLPIAQQQIVDAHLAGCSICRARLDEAQQMANLLYRLPRTKPAGDLTARINAKLAAQTVPYTPKTHWMGVLVPVMFAAGLVLLALAVSQWGGAVQWVQLPTEQTTLAWLGNLALDPSALFDGLQMSAEQMLAEATVDWDALFTLSTILLAMASIAGLAQLLSGEWLLGARLNADDSRSG